MFAELYRYALWFTIPLLFISIGLLIVAIVCLVRLLKKSLIARIPLAVRHIVEFFEEGPVILCIEGPFGTGRFAWLKYRLEAEDGIEVPWRRRWFPARTSGMSYVRMEVRRFMLPRPGRYVLHVDGIKPTEAASPNHSLVFMRPHLAKAIALVVGITLSSGLSIFALVMSLIRILDIPT